MRVRGVDVTYPRVLLAALLVVTVAAGGYAAATTSASFGSHNPGWDGSESLRVMADSRADATIGREASAYDHADAPNTTAVVLSPQTPFDATEIERVSSFLDRGGTLVVAGDFGPETNRLLAGLGVQSRVDGRLVRDERFYYRGPALPVAGNVSEPLAAHTGSLTLNHGSVLRPGANATVLVRTSGFAYLDENRNGRLDDQETLREYPVVATESVGDGTVVVVSDPSVFINTMLDRDGNRAFAAHLLAQRDAVLLDYSHTADLPVAAVALLVLADSWLLQVLLGAVLLAGIGLAGERRGVLDPVRGLVGRADDSGDDDISEDAVVAAVADRRPDWDEDQLRRVTQSIRAGPPEQRDDD